MQVRVVAVNAVLFGAPQSRTRLIIVGAREGLALPAAPAPTHAPPAKSKSCQLFSGQPLQNTKARRSCKQ